jgi:3-methyladenine DNA glycosylase AlkD
MSNNFQKEIRRLKNPAKAEVLAGFFKTGKGQYGEGDLFLGVMVPETRKLVKKYWKLERDRVIELLFSKFHEERLGAVLILVEQFQRGDEKTKKEIFDFYLENAKQINSWDLVDLSADKIVGAFLEGKSKNILFELVKSEVLWERRIAMLATFFEIKKGRSETALLIAEKLLFDKHDLMHKAVGWMLREVGKRCSQAEEEVFLRRHIKNMPRTTLRYAIERFSPEKRMQYLNM